MTRNTNFFDQIEDYSMEQLGSEIKLEFEAELKANPELRQELKLWNEIQSAIEEKDILNLREKLVNVADQNSFDINGDDTFELLNDFDDINELTDNLTSEELIGYFDSLPKVHVYHHQANSNENIHQFYKKQNELREVLPGNDEFDIDLSEFIGLEEAILEKDILQLRQTLTQVSKSVEPQHSLEEIDDYLNNELAGTDLFDFERDLIQNRSLQSEVKLHKAIDTALQENDIISLRSKLSGILNSETSWNVSETSIEDFVDGMLEGELFEEFNAELYDNIDLQAEVELRKHINEAIGEKDVIGLRAKLKAAKDNSESQKVKMLIPETKSEHFRFWRTSVAIFVVLLGITGVLHNGFVSVNSTYNRFYSTPVWSPERSVSSDISLIQKANLYYQNSEFDQVIQLLSKVEDQNKQPALLFYIASSYQNLERYNEAIAGYSKVINHGDNLFVEEAQWYRSLCYLREGDKNKAKSELLAVIERKGHFEKDAKAVLRRLKYSMK